MRGMAVAANRAAADAGADMLRAGGNAVDAAVAVAAALSVTDPANCGLAGYGGFMVVDRPGGGGAIGIDFNTAAPAAFRPDGFDQAGRSGPFRQGAASVSLPAVLPGLAAAHRALGSLPFADLLAPAVELAAGGFPVGRDLARGLAWAAERHGGLSAEFRAIFFRDGEPLKAGERLTQPDLAASLGHVARFGDAGWRSGPLVEAICGLVASEGGSLSQADFAAAEPVVGAVETTRFDDAVVHGPARCGSGLDILCRSLEDLLDRDLGDNRGAAYARELAAALRAGWQEREAGWSPAARGSQHTSHFCTADADGMLVSCTFTHGPLWFGSGLVAPGTGLVLNCGANLIARRRADGALRPLANLAPVIVACGDGSRHAIGSPGGYRIPAVVLQAVVDLVRYRLPLAQALPLPRVSVDAAGRLEAEPPLAASLGAAPIPAADYYGPASALSVTPDGCAVAACDPRFDEAAASSPASAPVRRPFREAARCR